MSHSKRNTSLAFFTSYEREQLKSSWGTQQTRLGRESFLPFASCNLCLQEARDPVACAARGDVFCRECIVANLLAQKTEIKRLAREDLRRQTEHDTEKAIQTQREHSRLVEDFERMQNGLGVDSSTASRATKRKHREITHDESTIQIQEQSVPKPSSKENFVFDEQRMHQSVRKATESARHAIEVEATAKETLKSFWIPSLTPQTNETARSKTKSQTACPCSTSTEQHLLGLKTLVNIHFSLSEGTKDSGRSSNAKDARICPSCSKPLTATAKAVLAIPCGHVLCKPCSERFLDPEENTALRCYVCNTALDDHSNDVHENTRDSPINVKRKGNNRGPLMRGLVEVRSEGTGFAGGGRNMVAKGGVAFQC